MRKEMMIEAGQAFRPSTFDPDGAEAGAKWVSLWRRLCRVVLLAFLWILATSGPAASSAGFWDHRFFLNGINGMVNALAVSGEDLYAGGSFTSADGLTVSNIARWNGTHWSALGAGVNGPVNAIAVRGHAVYVGGTFTAAGGLSAHRVAQWDGTNWSALGSGIGGNRVNALAVSGSGVLYAAGDFVAAGGVNATNVAQWDGTNWSALGTGVTDVYQAYASALAVMGHDLFVGGYFTEAGRVSADNLARWDGANWSAVGGGLDDPDYPAQVSALAVSGNQLYVGGSFSTAGSVNAHNVARWDGTSWSALGDGLGRYFGDLPVTALAVSGHRLLVGGRFVSAGGIMASNLAEWDGTQWRGVGSGLAGPIQALAVDATHYYVGGTVTPTNAMTSMALVTWTGTEWSEVSMGGGQGIYGPRSCTLTTCQGDNVAALAGGGSTVYAGGSFIAAGGVPATNVARWNGTNWSAMGGGVNGPVFALGVLGSDLFAGGRFTSAGGALASNLAQWNGTNWSAVGGGLSGPVYALAVSETQLFVGGAFVTAGGRSATNVALWDGRHWSAVGSGVDGPVYAMAVKGSRLFVGGKFNVAGGIAASNVAQWDGSHWAALGGGVGGVVNPVARVRPPPVSALVTVANDLYVGGDFARAGGLNATNLARWNGVNWSAVDGGVLGVASLTPPPTVSALAVNGTELCVGGSFNQAGGTSQRSLAVWDGTRWTALGDGVGSDASSPPAVQALVIWGGEWLVGGHFKSAGGWPASDFTIRHAGLALHITQAGEAVVVSWPNAADGCALQATATLPAASWQPVTNRPVLMGSQWSVTLTEPGPSKFYRLQRP